MFSFLSGVYVYIVAWALLGQDSGDNLGPDNLTDFAVSRITGRVICCLIFPKNKKKQNWFHCRARILAITWKVWSAENWTNPYRFHCRLFPSQFVHISPEFSFSAMLENSQLVYLPSVRILIKLFSFIFFVFLFVSRWPWGIGQFRYLFIICYWYHSISLGLQPGQESFLQTLSTLGQRNSGTVYENLVHIWILR